MIIDKLENAEFYYGLGEKYQKAFEFLKNTDMKNIENGKHEINGDEIFVSVQDYQTKTENGAEFEAHKKYVDIQYIVEGEEKVYIAPISALEIEEEYSEQKDVMFFKDQSEVCISVLRAKGYVVLFPNDGHKPGVKVNEPVKVKKVVGKVRI